MTTHAPPQADADYPTAALRKSGALDGGRVAAATVVHTFPTILSRFHRLKLDYEGIDDAPRHLYLKSGLPGSPSGAMDSGRREVAFLLRHRCPDHSAGLAAALLRWAGRS